VRVVGSGRTDAGVHAIAQVAHIRIRATIPQERLKAALNSVLPSDIVVTQVEEASPGFHARFDAKSKRYRYCIVNGPTVLPFERRYVHHVRAPLNVPLMRREAALLHGRLDMRAFHKAGRPVSDTRRTISEIRIGRRGMRLLIEIEASGFLYTMMRRIVGTLIDIGRGHRPPGTMARIFRVNAYGLVGQTAPAKGLFLLEVKY
jgi:tRNA pseudouridine38-40 synthase